MQLATVTALRDWLAGDTFAAAGVNALLPHVPRLPEDPLAPESIALFADPYRVPKASDFGERPSRLPALYVLPDGPVHMAGEVSAIHRQATSVTVAVRVIIGDSSKTGSHRYAAYVLRALEQSLARFLDESPEGRAARLRNGIAITNANAVTHGPWRESVGDAMAVAVFAVDFNVRDTVPRG